MVASGESSVNLQAPWLHGAALRPPGTPVLGATPQKSASYSDLLSRRGTLEDVMQEFRMNGFDAPYNPEEDRQPDGLPSQSGRTPGRAFLRLWSWPPSTERSRGWQPRPDAPEFRPTCPPPTTDVMSVGSLPVEAVTSPVSEAVTQPTPEQLVALCSLPTDALRTLLREIEQRRGDQGSKWQMCRFCKNNGERESYYRSHELRDAAGRVSCPVLRAYRCARCGARGDNAHTIKYCPYTTTDERITSAAMMRSVRMAAVRRRARAGGDRARAASATHHLDGFVPLDPLWQALEHKLML